MFIFKKKKNKTALSSLIIKKILKLGLPVLIKPNNQGSSIGMTLVSCITQINNAINLASIYDENILIEKFIKGKEYTISILGENILPSIHISTEHCFYDYNAKYKDSSTKYICPSGLPAQQEKELKRIAFLAWKILGCSGCGRIDTILDNQNQFWLLEVNTIPGMTNRSLVPISAKKIGISFDELVLSILDITK